jgi:hypothetical protein
VSLPDRSLLQCDAASVRYRRCFNRPTGLDGRTCVLLDCGLLAAAVSAQLNGQEIELPATGLLDITSELRPHNQLEIIIASDRFAEASTASARLQIRDSTLLGKDLADDPAVDIG